MPEPDAARMVVDQPGHEVQLDVRRVEVGARAQEPAALGEIAGEHAAPLAAEAAELAQHACGARERETERIEARRLEAEDEVGMVLQVAADAGRVVHHVDAERLQPCCGPDARQHQQLRRLQRAAREQHFAARQQPATLAALQDLGADRAPSLEQDAQHPGAGLDAQVRPSADVRVQIAPRRAPAFAFVLGDLVAAEPFLLGAVEVVVEREAGFPGGGAEASVEGVVGAQVRHPQRTVLSVEGAAQAPVALAQAEIRQHFVVGPAGRPLRCPAVVIAAMAADVDHRVDGR